MRARIFATVFLTSSSSLLKKVRTSLMNASTSSPSQRPKVHQCLRPRNAKKSPRNPRRGARITSMHFVYILECADGSLYVGCTNDLERRLKQHNDSKWGAHYTKIRRPVKLKHSETFATLREARQREVEIKGLRRGKKLNLIKTSKKPYRA